MSGRQLLRSIAFGGGVAISALVGLRLKRRYESDMQAAYGAIERAGTKVVDTSAGTVQYQTVGDGIPVLIAHGIVGGFDQALQTGEHLLDADARLVGVSRFGYLGSELPDEPTPENQARAYAELLDELDIESAVVVGTSAGGPPAIRFALDYPERTRGLVLIGSAAPSNRPVEGPTGPPHAILRDSVFWILVNYAPWAFHRLFGIGRADYTTASPDARRRVEELLDTLLPVEPRIPGILNDEAVTNPAVIERYSEYTVETLDVPTLVIHAEDDPLASFADAKRMVQRIPDVEFRQYETGGHLVFGHGDEIRRSISEFMKQAKRT